MKPSNLLLNSDCLMKVADFGLARSLKHNRQDEVAPPLTDYVATRWYRAPEILLGSGHYTFGVDMWAVGCILGEMLLGKPIFPGSSTMNQLEKIAGLVGCPPKARLQKVSHFAPSMTENQPELANNQMAMLMEQEDLLIADIEQRQGTLDRVGAQIQQARAEGEAEDKLVVRERSFNESLSALNGKKKEREDSLQKQQMYMENQFRAVFKDASLDAIDLMIALLHFEPEKRVSAEGALAHRYIQQFHDPTAERVAERIVRPSIDDDDKKSTAFYRDKLYQQISDKRKGFGGGQLSGRDDGGASVRSYGDSRRG